jgi:hypothetical protein
MFCKSNQKGHDCILSMLGGDVNGSHLLPIRGDEIGFNSSKLLSAVFQTRFQDCLYYLDMTKAAGIVQWS